MWQQVNVRNWTLLVIFSVAVTVAFVSYILLPEPPTLLAKERSCFNHAFHLMNTTMFSRPKHVVATKPKKLTTAFLSTSQSQYRSWSKGVITQLYPAVKKNCTKLMAGDALEVAHVAEAMSVWKDENDCVDFLAELSDCDKIHEEFLYNFYVSAEEKRFPIAYILVVYTNPQQIVRFLKAVYRPQNVYCIHPDHASGKGFSEVFNLLSKCLGNVFVSSHIQEIHYGRNTIFQAQMSCYRDLDKYPADKWYYVINLCGRELPLKTNREIVKQLRRMNGTSVMWPTPVDNFTLHERFYRVQKTVSKITPGKLSDASKLVGPSPYGIKLYKSLSYNALSRTFVHFFLHNETVQIFLKWIKHAWVPEEHFYASVYMMSGSPGGHSPHHPQVHVTHVIWKHKKQSPYYRPSETCAGRSVHEVCVLTSAELPRVKNALNWNVFFFNKYFMEEDHVIMDCMEEVLVKKNIEEFNRDNNSIVRIDAI